MKHGKSEGFLLCSEFLHSSECTIKEFLTLSSSQVSAKAVIYGKQKRKEQLTITAIGMKTIKNSVRLTT